MADRIMVFQSHLHPNPRACEYGVLHGGEGFADVIKDPEMGKYS